MKMTSIPKFPSFSNSFDIFLAYNLKKDCQNHNFFIQGLEYDIGKIGLLFVTAGKRTNLTKYTTFSTTVIGTKGSLFRGTLQIILNKIYCIRIRTRGGIYGQIYPFA